MHHDPARAVMRAARRAVKTADTPLLLAVSGGLDSMALLDALAAVARRRVAGVATFHHGTGAAADEAGNLVNDAGARAGVPVFVGRIDARHRVTDGREAAWRTARHEFLRQTANRLGARVVTAHTEDDQVETVLMRVMRGSGARGLAGLYAESHILRPFLGIRRATLEGYVRARGVRWVDDPSNVSPEFARNRVRRDVLPALRRADPAIEHTLLGLARRAAGLRAELDMLVTACIRPNHSAVGRLVVASRELHGYDRDSLSMLWASLAGRAGLALDARGTQRIAAFTINRPTTGTIPLSGGWHLDATRESYVLHRLSARPPASAMSLPADGSLDWGEFRIRVSGERQAASPWGAAIAAPASIRAWTAGDRLEPASGQPRRRVKRYLSDVGLRGAERAGWPVVVSGNEVVWIPGVRRSDAATDRSGRPVRHYVCERIDR